MSAYTRIIILSFGLALTAAASEPELQFMVPSIDEPSGYSTTPGEGRFCPDKGGEGQKVCNVTDATVHGDVYRGCGGKQLYLSDGNCYRCQDGYKRNSLTKKMTVWDACQERGPQPQYTSSTFVKDAGFLQQCPGKQVYLSKGNCYSCPSGYKRTSLTRKMTDPEACKERGIPEPAYTYASFERDAFGCPEGQFKHLGKCKSCLEGTKRIHLVGIDSGKCNVPWRDHCIGDLVATKLKPDRMLTRAGNFLGMKVRKRCAPQIDFSAIANEAVVKSPAGPIMAAIVVFSARLAFDDAETKSKVAQLEKDLDDKNLNAAWATLRSFDEFGAIVQAVVDAGDFTITVGVGVDASLGVGYQQEHGIAIDFTENKFKGYYSSTFTKGLSAGYDASITIGIWEGALVTDYVQGMIVSGDAGVEGVPGVGVWTTYYNPGAPPGQRGQRFIGLTISGGVGHSLELGEHNEVYTEVISECAMDDLDEALIDNTIDVLKLAIGEGC